MQEKDRTSLRVGVSPDCTLAYIDFLCDEVSYGDVTSPLTPIGQPKLPAAFKFAGLGTYFSPWYVDTNDILLQAVAHTDVASVFIDEAFIDFIVELNKIVRTIHRVALRDGIRRLIKFFARKQSTDALGGLVIELCTFDNTNTVPESVTDVNRPSRLSAFLLNEGSRMDSADVLAELGRRTDISASGSFRQSNSVKLSLFGNIDGYGTESVHGTSTAFIDGFRSFLPTVGGVGGVGGADTVIGAGIARRNESFAASEQHNSEFNDSGSVVAPQQSVTGPSAADEAPSTNPSRIQTILSFLNTGLKFATSGTEDLSYPEAMQAVREGKLSLGIMISHPKVQLNHTRFEHEDFESDDEDELSKLSGAHFDNNSRSGDSLSSNIMRKLVIAAASSSSNINTNNNSTNINADIQMRSAATLRGVESSLTPTTKTTMAKKIAEVTSAAAVETSPYGIRANEMARYYEIMKAADLNNGKNPSPEDKYKLGGIQANGTNFSTNESSILAKPTHKDGKIVSSSSLLYPDESMRYSADSLDLDQNNPHNLDEHEHKKRPQTNKSAIIDEDLSESQSEADQNAYYAFPQASDRMSVDLESTRSRNLFAVNVEDFRSNSVVSDRLESTGDHHMNPMFGLTAPQLDLYSEKQSGKISHTTTSDSTGTGMQQQQQQQQQHSSRYDFSGLLQSLRSVRRANAMQKYACCDLAPSGHQHEITCWQLQKDGTIGAVDQHAADRNSLDDIHDVESRGVSEIALADRSTIGSTTPTLRESMQQNQPKAQVQLQSLQQSIPKKTKKSYIRYFWDRFVVSAFARIFLGGNIYPRGPTNVRKILECLIVFLCIADFALISNIATNYFCIWDTDCGTLFSHVGFILPSIIWPGALIAAPISGLMCVLLGPSGKLSRIHASWSRFAIISDIVVVIVLIKKHFNTPPYLVYLVGALLASRIVQCVIVDMYIGHVDSIRWTRGWDGLVTSLYAENDKKEMIRSD